MLNVELCKELHRAEVRSGKTEQEMMHEPDRWTEGQQDESSSLDQFSFWACLVSLIVFTGMSPVSCIPNPGLVHPSSPSCHIKYNKLTSCPIIFPIAKYLQLQGEPLTTVISDCKKPKAHGERQDLKARKVFRDNIFFDLIATQIFSSNDILPVT